jgi:recombination protein RecA
MGRQKKVEEDDIFNTLANQIGGEILGNLDTAKYFVDTGNLAINYCCSGKFVGGGIPAGRLTEIYGPSASSKSLIGANILFGCQRMGGIPVILDTENAVNQEFIQQASHCDVRKILRYTPQTLEESFSKMYLLIDAVRKDAKYAKYKDKPIVIVYDSISVSPCAREYREIHLPEKYTKAQYKEIVGGHEQPGERAKICSREFRKLNTVLEQNDATVIIMNQTREKIGINMPSYGLNEAKAGGGTALTYYASLILRSQSQKKLEVKMPGGRKKFIGVNIKMANKKNRSYRPFVEVDNIPLYFDRGINPLGGLLGALIDADRIEPLGAGNFLVKEQYSGQEKYKFKSSVERNDVPIEVLLNCPKLIDVDSKEELEIYLNPFMESIKSTRDEDLDVTDITSEDDEEKLDSELG